MIKKLFSVAALLVMGSVFAQETGQPKQMIMFIGDGFGTSAKVAARMALGQGTDGKRFTDDAGFHILSLDKLDYQGSLTTHSRNSWITDSGPGASAYAAGVNGKLDNEAISFNVGAGESVETILEKAKKAGYAVGLITTTRITHATPATFGSHIWFRDLEDYIASQYISSTEAQYEEIYNNASSTIAPYDAARDWELPAPKIGVEIDVLMGGGARHFLPNAYVQNVVDAAGNQILNGSGNPVTITGKRTDMVNLIDIAATRGYVNVNSRDALLNLDLSQFTPDNDAKLIGLFNASHVNYEQDRQMNASWEPSLPEMTQMAIEVLKAKGGAKGFFLLVEGGRIDHLEHANSGGITVVTGDTGNIYTVDSDKPSYVGGGEAIYAVTPTTPRHTDVFGSDYLIKEVLAFDYSIAQARKLLNETDSETLIFSSSDHECGGTAIVGLHDSANAQNNGTYVRTYALGPKQNGNNAASSGPATATTNANPAGVQRGDIDFGTTSPNGWYPNYTTSVFQGRSEEPWPSVSVDGRRIVVAYASNPLTNGNGQNAGGTPGNHTPMDVFVGAADNVGGTFSSQISGHGQLDNTYLNHIMEEFLMVDDLGVVDGTDRPAPGSMQLFPNPASGYVTLALELNNPSAISVGIYDMAGRRVNQFNRSEFAKSFNLDINTSGYTRGVYVINVQTEEGQFSKKLIKR
ncbi:alkaline phosphatase [Flavobacterium silvaticum]|uniref:T9SS type A sorting domain-containing protein n=1 Tax=Flavobacterium silvaticum TaxID=1852020 RepID=A0A972JG73_9FLAO|nr:alkaline phosphatase [Flavobacterium silvaticum]NMH27896.1 T9SS type A sorting domain-containing protein [Flavobacterium silvaticum]